MAIREKVKAGQQRLRLIPPFMPDDNIITKRRQALQQAMSLTEGTLRMRMKCYRGLVISVVLVAFFSLVWPTVQWSWMPLLGFLLFLPLTGAFLYVDTLLLNCWRQQLLTMWEQEALDVDILCDVLCAIRVVPERTLQGMLSSLPTLKNLQITENVGPVVRRALTATVQTINACQSDRTLFAVLAYTTGLGSLALAVVLASWLPLFGLLLVIPIYCAGWGIYKLRLRVWKRKVSALRQEGLEGWDFVELAALLDWQPISKKKKARILDELRGESATY